MRLLCSAIVALGAFFSVAEAQVCKPPSNKKIVKIYFANGMLTSQSDAASGLANIRKHFLEKLGDAVPEVQYEWHTAYNENEDIVDQVLEVARQKISDIATDDTITASDYIRMTAGYKETPAWYDDFLNKSSTYFDEKEYQVDEDLRKQVGLYRGDIAAGKRVIVFAHSQGNFYTNEAYDLLYKGEHPISKKSFGMVSIATPSNRVADGGPYTTFNEDGVINAVRKLFPGTLAGNTAFKPYKYIKFAIESLVNGTSDEFEEKVATLGAGLLTHVLKSYLWSDESTDKIFDDARNELITLQSTPPVISSGGISIALDWNSAKSDVDLHVVEPMDNEIYYGNTNGIGTLDRDVTDTAGPEHYVIACDKAAQGTYLVQAKYFAGTGGETARVELNAGGKSRVFTHSFDKPQTSNDKPVTIAKLVIGKDSSGKWTYDMQAAAQ